MKASPFVEEIIEKHIKDEELRKLLIVHSECVARKAIEVARSYGLLEIINSQFVFDAALLHDIGIVECDAPGIFCRGSLPYICHGVAGAEILQRDGIEEKYQRVCERHTGAGITIEDIETNQLPLPKRNFMPETIEEKLICYADKFFSKSGDPSEEKSLKQVETSLKRHGEKVWKRFLELERSFREFGKPISQKCC